MKVKLNQKSHDYPKKTGDLNLAWYHQGRICISRKQKQRSLQQQNINIILVNQLSKALWQDLNPVFKKDFVIYAKRYKHKYPCLRKRGVSSYAVFLILIHALIKCYAIICTNQAECLIILKKLLLRLSVKKAIKIKLMKPVNAYYQLNHFNENNPVSYDELLKSSLYLASNNIEYSKKQYFTPSVSGCSGFL
ncbi:MAG: hypothetical protein KA886_02725 [Candidatus Cloacimonetes bacterium]|nr:hypothetical protein [Candidatus Cloacimonadota bacterium]